MTDPSPLPLNLEAERALLGGLILDNRLIDQVIPMFPSPLVAAAAERVERRGAAQRGMRNPLFGAAANELVFGAICLHAERGDGADLTSLCATLHDHGLLQAVGGAPYLAELEDGLFALGQIPQLARVVLENWRRREAVLIGRDLIEAAGDGEKARTMLGEAGARLADLEGAASQKDWIAPSRVKQVIEDIRERTRTGHTPGSVATGIADLDSILSMLPGDLIILAARPSVGKTALGLNIAAHAALRMGLPVGMFSLEMKFEQLHQRLLSAEACVPFRLLKHALPLSRAEDEALEEAAGRISHARLWIDDGSSLTPMEMQARVRRLASRVGGQLGLIVVDYLQLMSGGGRKYDNRNVEVSAISRALKQAAKEFNCPVLALSQLSRQSEQRGKRDSRPKLSDLRDSGAIEQDADAVLFIHRQLEAVRPSASGYIPPSPAEVIIRKQRNGEVGTIDLLFDGAHQRFLSEARGN